MKFKFNYTFGQSHKLTSEDAEVLCAALNAPVVVSELAAKSARSFAVRVVNADNAVPILTRI